MAYIDTNRILNESPKKRLIIGFENLKKNYTKENALEYAKLYNSESLSFLLENSRMIFSESFYGKDFYKDVICNKDHECCCFDKYKEQLECIVDFIDENGSKMTEEQRKEFECLADELRIKIKGMSNTITMAEYALEKTEDKEFSTKLSDAIYKEDFESVKKIFESVDDPKLFFIFAPYINNRYNGFITESMIDKYYNTEITESEAVEHDNYKKFVESVAIVSKLSNDEAYKEAINNIPKLPRMVIEGLAEESLLNQINEITIERVNEKEFDNYYSSPVAAVNRIFEERYSDSITADDDNASKIERYGLQNVAYEVLREMVEYEFVHAEETDEIIIGYNFFNEGTTIEDALYQVTEKADTTHMLVEEASKEEDDEDINLDDEETSDDEKDDSSKDIRGASSKKVEAPKPKNIANKIQFKAQDKEVQQRKKIAAAKQKGQETKNAAKAVSKLSQNVINEIKDQIKIIDDKDDDRRKKYFTAPGFRKKAFKNLQLAALYGTTAHIKLAYLPVVAFIRHLSKSKDRRIRNELLMELETEIKITDEKIQDATNAGDNTQKYQLMRIKSKLEAERIRVRTNSKYI